MNKLLGFFKNISEYSKVHKELIILKLLPIIISIIAIIISAKSCSNSDTAIELSKNQAMPFLQVVDVKLVSPVSNSPFITLDLTIKNLGNIAANDVSAEMDYCVGLIGPSNNFKGNSVTRIEIGDIGQGFERTIRLKSNKFNHEDWKIGNSKFYNTGYFFGTIIYTNKIISSKKKIDWCYELPLKEDIDINTLSLYPSQNKIFESEYKIENQ